jgi:hypothetical protein
MNHACNDERICTSLLRGVNSVIRESHGGGAKRFRKSRRLYVR